MGRGLNALMAGLGVDVGAAEEEGQRRRVNRMALQDAERKYQSQNALRGLARESYNPGSPAVTATPGTPDRFEAPAYQPPMYGNALGAGEPPSLLMTPGTPGPGSPAMPESFDRGGFKRKAVGQGIDIDQINNFLGGMDESERKAFKNEIEDYKNTATWVAYGGPKEEVLGRLRAATTTMARQGKDVSKFKDIQTPEEAYPVIMQFIDQAEQIKVLAEQGKTRRASIREGRASTAGIVTEKDAWKAVDAERKRLDKKKADSWEDIDTDAELDDYVTSMVPAKFHKYIADMRRRGPGAAKARPLVKTGKGNAVIRYDSKGNRIQ